MDFTRAYKKFRRVKTKGKYNIDDVDATEIQQVIAQLATQMNVRVREGDPRSWTVEKVRPNSF